MNRNTGSAYERTFLGIAIVVTIVWSVATIVQVAFPAHPVPETVNLVMGTVATAFFGGALISSRRKPTDYRDEEGNIHERRDLPPRRPSTPRRKDKV